MSSALKTMVKLDRLMLDELGNGDGTPIEEVAGTIAGCALRWLEARERVPCDETLIDATEVNLERAAAIWMGIG